MKKARAFFTPIDQQYNKVYGHYPDYDYIAIARKQGAETANKTIQERVNKIWADMKQTHAEQERKTQLQLQQECPF